MAIRQSWQELDDQDEALRQQINALGDEQRRDFYREQSACLKDPDTYAALNWLFLGGFHHLYLRKYRLFALEFSLLCIALLGWLLGYVWLLILLAFMLLYELPQLFFSQKIVRQYNYQQSRKLLEYYQRHR